MEVEFDVNITFNVMYDYLLSHAYSGLQGMLGTLVGALLIVAFSMTKYPIYLIFGAVIILYLPCNLILKAKQQSMNSIFKKPLHYKMTEDGVEVSQGNLIEMQKWENMHKAVSTKNSIILYTSVANASIFPKNDLKDSKSKVIEMISTHMPPKKVKIKD
ncbi:MAG TPA: YcxB family protein [Lachnospiraceae bacterium]|nr:YcxB family protein [Lachnospiraceae bacterium]